MSTTTPEKTTVAKPHPPWKFTADGVPIPPDDAHLPDHDGTFVKNLQEHPQSLILTDSIMPVLKRIHPDGHFCIGQDVGIYWHLTDPLERGAECPDWFYVPNVPPTRPGGVPRRSYVLWQDLVPPLLVLEFVSGDGSEERDVTPYQGKFWVYERVIRPIYYGIFEAGLNRLEMYRLDEGRYQPMPANESGRFSILEMGVELGLRRDLYFGMDLPWLRWWDPEGRLLPSGHEQADQEHQRAELEHRRAEQERRRAEQEQQRAERLAAQLRALGIEPEV